MTLDNYILTVMLFRLLMNKRFYFTVTFIFVTICYIYTFCAHNINGNTCATAKIESGLLQNQSGRTTGLVKRICNLDIP